MTDLGAYIRILLVILNLIFRFAPLENLNDHIAQILTGQHFAGEYWTGADGMALWWAQTVDDLLDIILPFRADH